MATEPLEKVGKGEWFSSCWLQPPTKLSKAAYGLWPDSATGFHSNRLELVGSVQMGIFLCLLRFSMYCSPTSLFSRCWPIGIGIGVYASGIPHQEFPMWPKDHGSPLGLFPSALYKPDGDEWCCLTSGDVRFSLDLICSSGQGGQIHWPVFHRNWRYAADIREHLPSGR